MYYTKNERSIKKHIGKKFGRLTVLDIGSPSISSSGRKRNRLKCICDCGKEREVFSDALTGGKSKSCGCLGLQNRISARTSHGMSGSLIYATWRTMWDRCENKRNKKYLIYGGRGISVCKRWSSFENFYKDMGEKPSKIHSIDRVDNNKGYCKENCRWATNTEQSNNRRTTRKIKHDGKILNMQEWSRLIGGSHGLVSDRVSRGMSEIEAITKAIK